jgi:hypothetical protein
MHKATLILAVSALVFSGVPVSAQQQQAPPPLQQQTPQAAAQPAPATTQGPPSDGKIRIYVSDSQSWQMTGGWGAANGAGGVPSQVLFVLASMDQLLANPIAREEMDAMRKSRSVLS